MNNPNDRIDQIEALVEANARAIDSLTEQVDGITVAVQANQEQIATTSLAVERLADVVFQVAQRVDSQVNTIALQQTAINAELERQGRILDYLMRGDPNRNGDQPPA